MTIRFDSTGLFIERDPDFSQYLSGERFLEWVRDHADLQYCREISIAASIRMQEADYTATIPVPLRPESEDAQFACQQCDASFDSDDETPRCPSCGSYKVLETSSSPSLERP